MTSTQHDASAASIAVRQDSGDFADATSGTAFAALAVPAVGATSTVAVRVTAQDGAVSNYVLTLTQAHAIAPAAFTIYAIGDSTMADYDPVAFPNQAGWGQMFRDLQDTRHVLNKAEELAGEIRRIKAIDPDRPVYLVGKSGGTGLALATAELLPPQTLERVILLSAAVSPTYDLRRALEAKRGQP